MTLTMRIITGHPRHARTSGKPAHPADTVRTSATTTREFRGTLGVRQRDESAYTHADEALTDAPTPMPDAPSAEIGAMERLEHERVLIPSCTHFLPAKRKYSCFVTTTTSSKGGIADALDSKPSEGLATVFGQSPARVAQSFVLTATQGAAGSITTGPAKSSKDYVKGSDSVVVEVYAPTGDLRATSTALHTVSFVGRTNDSSVVTDPTSTTVGSHSEPTKWKMSYPSNGGAQATAT